MRLIINSERPKSNTTVLQTDYVMQYLTITNEMMWLF